MTASPPQDDRDLSHLAGTFEAMLGWSNGTRREQLLSMRLHLDLAAIQAAELIDSAARHSRADAGRGEQDLAQAVAQLEAMSQTFEAYRVELLAIAAAKDRHPSGHGQ